MTSSRNAEAELVAMYPAFKVWWDNERDLWTAEDSSFSVHGLFAVFSDYVADLLERGPTAELSSVFDYVESKLTETDTELDNAVTTCFLENLMNRVPKKLPPQIFVPLLGPKSRQFCRAYDEWCGMKTEGLW